MNTNVLAKKLGVSPKTIRRWIQLFEIPSTKNEHGHYIFTYQDFTCFNEIKENIRKGKSVKEIKQNIEKKHSGVYTEMNKDHESNEKFQQINQQLKILEKIIHEKADDVVSYQILQHRKEIEELQSKILSLEEKINQIEMKVTKTEQENQNQESEKRKRKGFIRAVLG